MTRRLKRADVGNAVFDCLMMMDPTTEEGVDYTGLSRAQWHAGLEYVRNVLAEHHAEPIVYDAKTRRYSFATSTTKELEVERYIGARINTFLIQLLHLYDGTFVPAGVRLETNATRAYRDADRAIQRLIEDLQRLADEYPSAAPALARRDRDREKASA